MEERIRGKLARAFSPSELRIDDVSAHHEGHAGWREGGGTHFHLTMRSAHFEGLSRIHRQRAVYRVLSEEFADGLHALSMELGTP